MEDINGNHPFIYADKELLLGLGRVVIYFGALESIVDTCILISIKDSHSAFTAIFELSFRAKFGVLMTEYKEKISDPKKCE
jgi:hypothetical protein